jgi:hypothetical protein
MVRSVLTISRTLRRPVACFDRTLGTRRLASAQPSGSTPEQEPVSARPHASSGNDDTVHEWHSDDVGMSIPAWRAVTERRAVAEWQSAVERRTVPEWQTDTWKRRVESEAKKRFDREIAGVGRLRS